MHAGFSCDIYRKNRFVCVERESRQRAYFENSF